MIFIILYRLAMYRIVYILTIWESSNNIVVIYNKYFVRNQNLLNDMEMETMCNQIKETVVLNENRDYARDLIRYIGRLEQQRRRYINESLRAYKLHHSMFRVILALDREPGVSQDYISDILWIDKSNVARLCRQLEELRYIRREQSQEDRRQKKLYLTDNGRELLPEIRRLLSKYQEIVTEGMDEREAKEVLRLLEHMMENASKLW